MSAIVTAIRTVDRAAARSVTGGSTGTRTPIVYAYPGCRWDMLPPARHRYLMEAMSGYTRVVFLNAPTSGNGFFAASRPVVEHLGNNVLLVHETFGLRATRLGKRLGPIARAIDGRWLDCALRQFGIRDYLYWVGAPDPRLLQGMRYKRVIYDCIDPCFSEEVRKEFDRAEFAIARRASMVFCTAHALLERMRPVNPACCLLPNACDNEKYHPEALAGVAIPELLRGRPRPIIGYMGTVDWRVDVGAIAHAARRLSNYTFAIVGRVNPGQEKDVYEASTLPNIVFAGAVPYEAGRAYTAAFDVGLIPFHPGPVGDAINPVKMYMYLAAGKPVVSTWCAECVKAMPVVRAARNHDEFVDLIRDAVEHDTPMELQLRLDFAARNSWQVRAAQAMRCLEAHGLIDGCPANDTPRFEP